MSNFDREYDAMQLIEDWVNAQLRKLIDKYYPYGEMSVSIKMDIDKIIKGEAL